MTTPLTCQELVELVTDYFEEKLSAAELQRFEAHLATCQGCQAYLSQMRQTLGLLGKLTETDLAPETQQELLQIFRDWKASSPS
jgi:anti-sigma factor RsiW